MPALVAALRKLGLKIVSKRLRAARQPSNAALTALMGKRATLANTCLRDLGEWTERAA